MSPTFPDRTRPRLLILGCSTRAAAWSAVRAGFFPVCADEFGDADLHQVAEVLPQLTDQDGRRDFDTRPTVVAAARISVSESTLQHAVSHSLERYCGPYLGSTGAAVVVAGGCVVWGLLVQMQLPFLETCISPRAGFYTRLLTEDLLAKVEWNRPRAVELSDWVRVFVESFEGWREPPTDGAWLQKPIRSGGGRGIRWWTADAAAHPMREPTYFQRYQPGDAHSAVFLAQSGSTTLIGVTRQLIGDAAASSPSDFGYCGSIGPCRLPEPATSMVRRVADELARVTGIVGLFGVDFIWDGETPWVVEVNPRYTASCEILELALRRPLLTEHWRACLPDGDPPPQPWPVEPRCGANPPVLGKMIVYAKQSVVAPDWSRLLQSRSPWTVPYLADIPRVGTRFEPGQPVCTVFASGDDYDACYCKLVRRVRRVREWLGENACV